MRLPNPDAQYSQVNEAETRRILAQSDAQNLKRGENIQLKAGQYIILPDEDNDDLYRLKVASGVLSIVAYP